MGKLMKKELEQKLVEKYPTLYSGYGGDISKTCMAWGFECGDGWLGLIDELSEKLTPFNIIAAQVKTKFGLLRFYVEYGSMEHLSKEEKQEVYNIIFDFEDKSKTTCELCGAAGERQRSDYVRTLCATCAEQIRGVKYEEGG